MLAPPLPITHLMVHPSAPALWAQSPAWVLWWGFIHLAQWTERTWAMLELWSGFILALQGLSQGGTGKFHTRAKEVQSLKPGSTGQGRADFQCLKRVSDRSREWRPAPKERKGINKGQHCGSWWVVSHMPLSRGDHHSPVSSEWLPIPFSFV